MTKIILKMMLIIMMLSPSALSASDLTGNITVRMTGFHSDKGDVKITLFKSADGFPEEKDKAYKISSVQIENGKSQHTFTDVPYGEYGIAVHHDENSNGEMDKNFLGFPKEGFGTSNNKKSFGHPKYENAQFVMNARELTLDITVDY